jgi:hypothetical protein
LTPRVDACLNLSTFDRKAARLEAFPDLTSISDDEIFRQLRALEEEEEAVSHRRRRLHVQIDALRLERTSRLRQHVNEGDDIIPAVEQVARAVTEHEEPVADESPRFALEPDPIPDPSTLDEPELRELLRRLEQEEGEVSFHRRILHGRIDILRAERMARAHRGHIDLDQLKEILAANLVFKRPGNGS